jgi:hypothetical protein
MDRKKNIWLDAFIALYKKKQVTKLLRFPSVAGRSYPVLSESDSKIYFYIQVSDGLMTLIRVPNLTTTSTFLISAPDVRESSGGEWIGGKKIWKKRPQDFFFYRANLYDQFFPVFLPPTLDSDRSNPSCPEIAL